MIHAIRQGCLAIFTAVWACAATTLCGLLPGSWTNRGQAALDAVPGPGGELDGLPDSALSVQAEWEDWTKSSAELRAYTKYEAGIMYYYLVSCGGPC